MGTLPSSRLLAGLARRALRQSPAFVRMTVKTSPNAGAVPAAFAN
jgi:hypothetical protein